MSLPLVSVIVPVYNAARYIDDTVASILCQTYEAIEVLLIDDGSTDGSSELLDAMAAGESRVQVLHSENRGVSHARNLGIVAASGEWAMFVDADDFLDPGCVETLVSDAESSGAQIVLCGMTFDYLDDERCLLRSERHSSRRSASVSSLAHEGHMYEHLYEANYVQSACAKLFCMDVLRRNSLAFDETLSSYEDHYFVMDCLSVMAPLYIEERCFYHYLHRPGESNSSVYKPDMPFQMEKVAVRTMKFYRNVLLEDDSLMYTRIVQFLVVAINNVAKGFRFFGRRKAFASLFERAIFSEAVRSATTFPNLYSRLVGFLGCKKLYGCILLLASVRNAIRSRYAA